MSNPPHACPKCGCRDTRPDPSRTRWGETVHHRRCRHCGALFSPGPIFGWTPRPPKPAPDSARPELEAPGRLVPLRTRCPDCGSRNTRVRSTQRPVRYHICRACQKRFKTATE